MPHLKSPLGDLTEDTLCDVDGDVTRYTETSRVEEIKSRIFDDNGLDIALSKCIVIIMLLKIL